MAKKKKPSKAPKPKNGPRGGQRPLPPPKLVEEGDPEKCNDKQRLFVDMLILHKFNQTKAARSAGYGNTDASARTQASVLLTNPNVLALLASKRREITKHYELSRDRIIEELQRIAYSDMRRVVQWGPDKGVVPYDSETLDPNDSATIETIKVTEIVLSTSEGATINDDGEVKPAKEQVLKRVWEIGLHKKVPALQTLLKVTDDSGSEDDPDMKSAIEEIEKEQDDE